MKKLVLVASILIAVSASATQSVNNESMDFQMKQASAAISKIAAEGLAKQE